MPRTSSTLDERTQVRLELPHEALRPWVSRYVAIQSDVAPGSVVQNRTSAVERPTAHFLWSGNVQALDVNGQDVTVTPAAFAGPLPRWHGHRYSGSLRAFFVLFTARGAFELLRLHCDGMADLALPLPDVVEGRLRPAVRIWTDQVMHAQGFSERVAVTEQFLLQRMTCIRVEPDAVTAATTAIEQTRGILRVADLASSLDVTSRTLRRHFRDRTGLSMKLFARIVRFRHARALLTRGLPWAEVAARLNYFDQAHLIRDYREFTGEPPTRYHFAERPLDRASRT
jgi:AraC-like DNA-binding protein